MKVEQSTKVTDWISTDADSGQFGKRLDAKVFVFKQDDIEQLIDLNTYKDSKIEEIISGYSYTLEEGGRGDIYLMYGEDANWIIAECIFEHQIS